jgi:hypothetical protein
MNLTVSAYAGSSNVDLHTVSWVFAMQVWNEHTRKSNSIQYLTIMSLMRVHCECKL